MIDLVIEIEIDVESTVRTLQVNVRMKSDHFSLEFWIGRMEKNKRKRGKRMGKEKRINVKIGER